MSKFALSRSFLFILRRFIFVTSALFMTSDTLVLMAVALYIVLSLLDLLYVAMAKHLSKG